MTDFDPSLLEGLAVQAYESVGFDPEEPERATTLARAHLGPNAIERVGNLVSAPAVLIVVNGEQRIAIKRSVPQDSAPFLVAHELAHVLLRREGYRGEDEERAANYLAGALLAPRPAFRRALSAVGSDYRELADAFCATETFAALRESEVTGRPRVILARTFLWVRGSEWAWPDEQRLRTWARGRPGPGVRKTTLTDRPKRYVLDIEDLGDVG